MSKQQKQLFFDIFAGNVSLYGQNFGQLDYNNLTTRYNLTNREVDQVVNKANGNSKI